MGGIFIFFFFFSSRRRHTRLQGDWSSDVCSSDLLANGAADLPFPFYQRLKGMPGLKGAKVRLIFADHQGKPEVGQAEAERLITQEKVAALVGCWHSNVTAVASQVAERHGVPFLNAESSSPALTTRGFKWFFRTSPHDGHFTQVMNGTPWRSATRLATAVTLEC